MLQVGELISLVADFLYTNKKLYSLSIWLQYLDYFEN